MEPEQLVRIAARQLTNLNKPALPITIALPRIFAGNIVSDWRFVKPVTATGMGKEEDELIITQKVKPIKRVVPKPDYITPLQIRARAVVDQ